MPPAPASRSIFSQLDSHGEEYISVRQYLASCLLLKGRIEGVTILKIDNPDLTVRFDKRSQKLLKLTGWSNLQTLHGDNNDLSLLGKRGFVFAKGSGGLDFITGNINSIESAHATNKANKASVEVHEPEHTFVFSDIAIGRSYVLDKGWSSTPLPEGYDSFYMPAHKLDINDDGEFDLFEYQQAASFDARDPSNYEHKYFLRDPAQVLPRYVIRFKFVNENEKKPSIVPASNTLQAKKGPGSTMDDLDFFDPETHRPVSMRQKMKIAGTKLIIPVEQAFEQALADWKRDDPLIDGKKMWLEGQLDSIDERVRQVNLNYADVLEKIQETAAAATAQLQEFTKAKLDTLLSVEVELRRQKEQMLWMDSLVVKNFKSVSTKIDAAHAIVTSSLPGSETPSTTVPPGGHSHEDMHAAQRGVTDGQLEFLQIWKHHTTFRNAASRLKPLQHLEALNQVKPDIAVKTDLSVYIDQSVGRGGAPSGMQTPGSKAGGTADVTGRHPVTATEADKQVMRDTLRDMQKNHNYSQPPRPSEELLSHLLQSVIDVETERIQEVLSDALLEDRVPLPASLHRPSAAGVTYAPRELLDLLQPPVPTATNNEMVNHKELYYACMKTAIGHAPVTAKALPQSKPVEGHSHHHRHDKSKQSGHKHHHDYHRGGHNEKKVSEPTAEQQAKHAKQQEEQKKADDFEAHRVWQEQQTAHQRQAAQAETNHSVLKEHEQHAAMVAYQNEQGLTDPQLKKGMVHLTSTPTAAALTKAESMRKNQTVFTLDSLRRISDKFKQGFSLSAQAARRRAQVRTDSAREEAETSVESLSTSQLLSHDEAQALYYNLPFFAKPPGMNLLYSSAEQDGNGERFKLEELYTSSMMHPNPSLLLIQSGEFVFGAYLSHPLRVTGTGWAGSPACFVFSVTFDVKMPYHARNPPDGASLKRPVAFLAEREKLCVGNGDLVIHDGGLGQSALENCYGMGLTFASSEAGCFLAGQKEFPIDELELWAITP